MDSGQHFPECPCKAHQNTFEESNVTHIFLCVIGKTSSFLANSTNLDSSVVLIDYSAKLKYTCDGLLSFPGPNEISIITTKFNSFLVGASPNILSLKNLNSDKTVDDKPITNSFTYGMLRAAVNASKLIPFVMASSRPSQKQHATFSIPVPTMKKMINILFHRVLVESSGDYYKQILGKYPMKIPKARRKIYALIIWIGGSNLRRNLLETQLQSFYDSYSRMGERRGDNESVVGWGVTEDMFSCRPNSTKCHAAAPNGDFLPFMPKTILGRDMKRQDRGACVSSSTR